VPSAAADKLAARHGDDDEHGQKRKGNRYRHGYPVKGQLTKAAPFASK
jgi:hypothetical protein